MEMMDFDGKDISIHAPRVGSDALPPYLPPPWEISIHAPRVGSDSKDAQIFLLHLRQKGCFFVIFSKLGAIFRGSAEKGGGFPF